MAELFDTQDLLDQAARQPAPQSLEETPSQSFAAAYDASRRYSSGLAWQTNLADAAQDQIDAFKAKTGEQLPNPYRAPWNPMVADISKQMDQLAYVRARTSTKATELGDPSLNFPDEDTLYRAGIQKARTALGAQARLAEGQTTFGTSIASLAGSAKASFTDPMDLGLNAIAIGTLPEGGGIVRSLIGAGLNFGAQGAAEEAATYGYKQAVTPDYGLGSAAGNVAASALGGVAFEAGGKAVGALWRNVRGNPVAAASLPLATQDAARTAERVADLDTNNPFKTGPSGDAAHNEAIVKVESDLLNGREPIAPDATDTEGNARLQDVHVPREPSPLDLIDRQAKVGSPDLFDRVGRLDDDIAQARTALSDIVSRQPNEPPPLSPQVQSQLFALQEQLAAFTGKRRSSPRAQAIRDQIADLHNASASIDIDASDRDAQQAQFLRERINALTNDRAKIGPEINAARADAARRLGLPLDYAQAIDSQPSASGRAFIPQEPAVAAPDISASSIPTASRPTGLTPRLSHRARQLEQAGIAASPMEAAEAAHIETLPPSIANCLANLVRKGKITQAQADDARAIHDGILNDDLLRNMDQASAEAYAALKTAEIMEATAKAKKLELARKVTMFNANLDRINAHPDGPMAGFMALLDRDIRGHGGINVSSMEEDYAGQIAQRMHTAEEAYASKLAGLKQNVTGIRDMVREVFGAKTGDSVAAAAAKGWKEATSWAETKAKALGRAFEANDDWRLPQFWDTGRVNQMGAAEFRADLDKEIASGALRVFDPEAGKFVTGAERARVVTEAVRNIRLDLSKRAGPGSVFKTETRVFRFADGQQGADAYLRMMDKYGPGQGGYFGLLQSHAQKMSRELALFHVLGPSPRAAGDALLKEATKTEAERALDAPKGPLLDRIGATMLRGAGLEGRVAAERLLKYMTGQFGGVESETLAGIFSGLRSYLTSTSMGSAILTAVPADTVNWTMAANFRGMNTGRLAQNLVDTFLRDSPDKVAMATRLGITAHATSRAALATKQYGDQIIGQNLTGRMADFVIRSQGLHAWDSAIKRAFTMEMMATIGDRAGKAFADLDAPFAGFLRDYGFTPDEWSKLAKGQTMNAGEAKFLMPDSLEDDVRSKLMSAVYDERQFAYLAGGSNRVRAIAAGGGKAGTLSGEALRSFFLFKQFPMTMAATWGVRAAQEASQGRMSQAVQLGLFMTFAGALAIQAKQVIQGKDPLDMKDGFFWGEAALQGGAAGFYGDFLKEAFSQSRTSLTEAALGPLASIPAAVQGLTSGARRYAENGEQVNFGAQLADDIARFTPGSSMWYGRLAFNRFIADSLHRAIDPDYARSFQRARDNAQKKHDQQFWFGPGDQSPTRGPDFGAAFGR